MTEKEEAIDILESATMGVPESLKATISDKQKYTNVLYDVLAYRTFFQTLFREISICKPQFSCWFAIDISSRTR